MSKNNVVSLDKKREERQQGRRRMDFATKRAECTCQGTLMILKGESQSASKVVQTF